MEHETLDTSPATGPEHALYYTDDLIENLQLRWGEGLLSPGGAEELRRMLGKAEIDGLHVLDFGCGIGGYDALLVENHGAGHVTGVDIDEASLAVADRMRRQRRLQDRLDFVHVSPGPLPFQDRTFDTVFTKDSIVDLPEKAPVFDEMFRVARPGAWIFLSDWFRSEAPFTEEMRAWATEGGETYEMDTLKSAAAALSAAGFTQIETDDRNGWFRDFARDEYQRLKGPLFDTYVARFGRSQAETSVENARIRALLADQGQLRPGHVRGRKP
ncbi:class I SAM-dependent methyltransferase [Roseovarius sp. TE539]|uniref:class I SAM-dependent methyltransferase n=1 Tax=Roseovarius sp. TE539 TaxID=2249812 RepID=UPI0015EEDC2B|nr:class I SAM-dependent methyltransferase [Roseovarius sp. TE539]